jgi:hypothetical protein
MPKFGLGAAGTLHDSVLQRASAKHRVGMKTAD